MHPKRPHLSARLCAALLLLALLPSKPGSHKPVRLPSGSSPPVESRIDDLGHKWDDDGPAVFIRVCTDRPWFGLPPNTNDK